MHILYITPYVPSQIRTRPYNLIRSLIRLGHQITLVTAAGTSSEEQEQAAELRNWGIQVDIFGVPLVRSLVNCTLALPTREPLQAVYSYHRGMERRINELLQKKTFDVVHIEHLRASRLVRAVENTPKVYDSVDCISLLFEQATQQGAQLRSRLMTAIDLSRTRRYETQLLTQYDQIVITSWRDKEALDKLALRYLPPQARPAPVSVVTNGVDLEYFCPPKRVPNKQSSKNSVPDPTLVFTGKMSYHANIAAVLYFAQDILPHVWADNPNVRFQIVGKDPPEPVRQLATDERIQVTGTVADLRPYLAQATVAVCPALYAVGIQNKVLEAMAMGAPVVSTPAGCAALSTEESQEILIAEGEREFADAVLRILADPSLAEQLSVTGRRHVETHHSWDASAQRLVEIYAQAKRNAPSV